MPADAITPPSGGNLSPTTPGLTAPVGGGNLAPTAPASLVANGTPGSPAAPGLTEAVAGGNLAPTAPASLVANGTPGSPAAPGLTAPVAGGNLAPTAPASLVANGAAGSPAAPGRVTPVYSGIPVNPPEAIQPVNPVSGLAQLTQAAIELAITNDPAFLTAIGAAASDDVPPVLTVLLGESWSNGTVLRLDVFGFGAYFALGETYDGGPVLRPLVNDGVGTLPRVRYELSGSEGEGWYFDYDAGTAFFLASDNSAYPPTDELWEDRIGSDTISVLTTIEFDANPSASKVGQHLYIALADGGVEMREALRINPTIWSEPMNRGVSQIIEVDDPNASFEPITSADDATIITPSRFWIYLSYWLTRTADKTISGAVSFLNSITVSGSATVGSLMSSGSATVGSLIAASSARVTGAPAVPATSDSLITAAQAAAVHPTLTQLLGSLIRQWKWINGSTTAASGASASATSQTLGLTTTTTAGSQVYYQFLPWAGGLGGAHARRVRWGDRFRRLSFRVSCETMGLVNATATALICLGKNTGAGAGDLVANGVALRLIGNGAGGAVLWGVCHNGTALSTVNLGVTLGNAHATALIEIVSNGAGTITFLVDGVSRGTLTGGPTTNTSGAEVAMTAEIVGNGNLCLLSVSPVTTLIA